MRTGRPSRPDPSWPIGQIAAKLGVSEAEIGRRLGIPRQTLADWRRDGIPPARLKLVMAALRYLERRDK